MRIASVNLWMAVGCLALLLLGTAGCKRNKLDRWVVREFETPDWAGKEGLLQTATETPDGKVLLLRRRDIEEGTTELFGAEIKEPDFESDEVIYRYDPSKNPRELEVVGLRAWYDTTGPMTWDIQQVRRVPDKLTIQGATGKLGYGKNVIPVEGDAIVHMAAAMPAIQNKVAILSATRVLPDAATIGRGGQVTLKDFYHQAYDLNEVEIMGRPLFLPFSEGDDPKGMWAGKDRYVVYVDGQHSRVYIIHMDMMMNE